MTERVTYLREYEVDEAFDTTDNDAVLALTSADEDIDPGWVRVDSRSAVVTEENFDDGDDLWFLAADADNRQRPGNGAYAGPIGEAS